MARDARPLRNEGGRRKLVRRPPSVLPCMLPFLRFGLGWSIVGLLNYSISWPAFPDLSGLTQEVLAVIERARAKWEDAPKYPAHARPAPPARRQPRRSQGATQAGAAEEGADDQPQPETLRLF